MESIVPFLVVVVVAVTVWASTSRKKDHKAIERVWREAARELGGTFTRGTDPWFESDPMTISVTVDGVEVIVDHFERKSRDNPAVFTRLVAHARAPRDLRMRIGQEESLPEPSEATPMRDMESGDPAFDGFFRIQTNDEALCFLWLNGKVRQAMLDAPDYTMSLKKRWVKSMCEGLENDVERLVAAVEAVALFAARGRAIRDAWRRLARKLGVENPDDEVLWSKDGSSVLQFEREGIRFEIEVNRASPEGTDRDGRLGTWVRAGCLGPGEEFTITRRNKPRALAEADGPGDAETLEAAYRMVGPGARAFALSCPEPLRAELLALDPAIVYRDGLSVGLILDGVELRQKWIEPALMIVGHLAAPVVASPYR